MEKTLNSLLNEFEPTDELILIQKHYERLCKIWEMLEIIKDEFYELDDLNLTVSNNEINSRYKKEKFIDRDKAIEQLQKIIHQISYEIDMCCHKSQEIFFFQKMGKAIFLQKELKS